MICHYLYKYKPKRHNHKVKSKFSEIKGCFKSHTLLLLDDICRIEMHHLVNPVSYNRKYKKAKG